MLPPKYTGRMSASQVTGLIITGNVRFVSPFSTSLEKKTHFPTQNSLYYYNYILKNYNTKQSDNKKQYDTQDSFKIFFNP